MRKILIISLFAFWPYASYAVDKTDFAYGYSLEVDGDGAIYTLELTEKIYQGLTRSDRGDLRIFNSRGETVPHYIRRLENRVREQQPDKELKLFPLYKSKSSLQSNGDLNVRITTNEKGAIIDMNYGKQEPADRVLNGYLLDASEYEQVFSEMEFGWVETHPDFVVRINLEASNDLNNWQRIVSGHVLSHLHYAGHKLARNEVEFAGKKYRYFRINWQGEAPIELSSVKARSPVSYSEQPRQWSNYEVKQQDETQNAYYFYTGSVLPADRLQIKNLQRNTLARVSIESARDIKGPWFMRYSGIIYDLQYENERVSTAPIHLPYTTDTHWRIQVVDTEGRLGDAPQLSLGWLPEQLLFVAQGEAPYTLAYGSARVKRQSTPLPQLMFNEDELRQQGKLIKSAQLGSVVQLGDKSRLQPPRPAVDWKQYILWIVLVLGVIVLAIMVLRLYRQMEKNDTAE